MSQIREHVERPATARRPQSPEKQIERIRNRSERRIKGWRRGLEQRVGAERVERRRRIAEIRASLDATQLSDKGAQMIVRFEGEVLHAYNDPVGHCTAGAGHLIHLGNCTAADFAAWQGMTHADVIKLLHKDAARFEAAVRDRVTVSLEQHEFDALVSFAFNVGEGIGGFGDSTLLRLLNDGDRKGAAAQFGRWVKAGGQTLPGLVTRRAAERRLFVDGVYP